MLVNIWNQWEVWAIKEKAKGRNNGMLEEVGERSNWRSWSCKENRGKQRPKMKLEHLEQRKLPTMLKWCDNTLKGVPHNCTYLRKLPQNSFLKFENSFSWVLSFHSYNSKIWDMSYGNKNWKLNQTLFQLVGPTNFELYNWKQPNPNTL